jgi:hypothetical protein
MLPGDNLGGGGSNCEETEEREDHCYAVGHKVRIGALESERIPGIWKSRTPVARLSNYPPLEEELAIDLMHSYKLRATTYQKHHSGTPFLVQYRKNFGAWPSSESE